MILVCRPDVRTQAPLPANTNLAQMSTNLNAILVPRSLTRQVRREKGRVTERTDTLSRTVVQEPSRRGDDGKGDRMQGQRPEHQA